MTHLTRSLPQNITSPDGNSLALYIDEPSGRMYLKDINGVIQPLSDYISAILPIILPSGAFYSTQAQPSVPNTETPVTFNGQYFSDGITLQNNSEFVIPESGTYDFHSNVQLSKSQGGTIEVIYLYYRVNNQNVPYTTVAVSLQGNAMVLLASQNIMLKLNTGDRVQLMWFTADQHISLVLPTVAALIPVAPSASITITKTA